jgi:hypothetical protein
VAVKQQIVVPGIVRSFALIDHGVRRGVGGVRSGRTVLDNARVLCSMRSGRFLLGLEALMVGVKGKANAMTRSARTKLRSNFGFRGLFEGIAMALPFG